MVNGNDCGNLEQRRTMATNRDGDGYCVVVITFKVLRPFFFAARALNPKTLGTVLANFPKTLGTILANLVGIVSYQQKLELNMNLYGSTKYYSNINT
jgi:hypothetical protein